MKDFEQLFSELEHKVRSRVTGSRTVAEYDQGIHHIGKKVIEEAGEVWLAAEHETPDRTAEEISQLLYHIQVLMLAKGLTVSDIYRYL